jgi:hypothetical protein
MSSYVDYYVRQAQTGSGMTYFAGSASQKGYGIGSFLGGLFRTIVPFLASGARSIGQEALRAGSHVLADVVSGAVPVGSSVQMHAQQAGRNLLTKAADRMRGNGARRGKVARRKPLKKITFPPDLFSANHGPSGRR